ncbi:YaaL family protein [Vallitalea pronyensis]|uniref:YaaL family protein n=1 Tax=Vallitalea pronyensis TaxID=1348613 RepID=A0A8J8MFY7_9FIRM|nr:YaaL family protein [Vallitalea pronyensis]QUI20930.1 YaaL family protein [Vallitalea pronyensis]
MRNQLNVDYDHDHANKLSEEDFILKNIDIAKRALDNAYNNFEVATDPDLIDSCIYEVKAMQLKYQYLISEAKRMNIIAKLR